MEILYLEGLRDAVKAQPQAQSPGEFGLARLQRDMARPAPQKAHADDGHGWRNLAIAACLALVMFGSLSIGDWVGDGGTPQLAGGDSNAVIQITFKPDAAEFAIRSLLHDVGASITGGPSALGVYHLSLGADSDDTAIAGVLKRLRERTDVVETAERE